MLPNETAQQQAQSKQEENPVPTGFKSLQNTS